MATLDISRALFSLLPPIPRVSFSPLSPLSPPPVFATSSSHSLSLALTLPHLHRQRTLPPCISRQTNAQFSDDTGASESEEFLEEEEEDDEADDSDGGVDNDDDDDDDDDEEVANRSYSLDVDALEEEAKHAVREYSRFLSRQLSIGE